MFFPFGNFLISPISRGLFLHQNHPIKNIGLRASSRAWDHAICLQCPLIEQQYYVFGMCMCLFAWLCDMCSSGCTVQSWGITLTMFVNKLICLWWWVESQWWQVSCGGELTVIRLHCSQSLMFDLCQLLIIVQLYTQGLQIITYSKDICSVFSAEAEVRAVLTFHMYLWAKLSGILTKIRWQSLNFPSLMRIILSLEYR